MKIEIGESLLLSWLRHVKGCQLVQMNWKPSSASWELMNEDVLQKIMDESSKFFADKYGYEIYKRNKSFRQLIQQAEIDVLGTSYKNGNYAVYAIDVAFHESGLNYGSKHETAMRVVKKMFRTAMCIYGYFGYSNGEIIFASPKIYNNVLEIVCPQIKQVEEILISNELDFKIRLISNENFRDEIFQPVMKVASNVADTSELFIRSIQLHNLFSNKNKKIVSNSTSRNEGRAIGGKMKIGAFVRTTLKKMFENGEVSPEEVQKMQSEEYSKKTFGIQYPLLVKVAFSGGKKVPRYWSEPVSIFGETYFMCSEWYENEQNNDRLFFEEWLQETQKKSDSSF